MQLKPVEEQVVALMGASSGIGRETALRFAKRGAKVVVSARGEQGLDSLVDEIRRGGGEAVAVLADVAEFEQVKAVADRAVEEYGRLDTWVHLAAVLLVASFEETTPEEFARVIDVNLMGQAYGAMAALPHIKREGGGALIHVSSMGAKRSIPLQSAYCASKHGIDGFLESLRVELQRENLPISVTQVMPATINTPFFAKALILSQTVSPRLLDILLKLRGFEVHYTSEPKPEDAPDNLFESIDGYNTVEGSFRDRAHPRSLYNWLQLHPTVKRGAVAGMAIGALGALRRMM